MKYTVYILHSASHDKIYIGITSDLEKRLYVHNNLPKGWTKSFRPWRIICTEKYETKPEALEREKQMKSHAGRDFIRTKILKFE